MEVDEEGSPRAAGALIWSSLVAWGMGVLALSQALWADANRTGVQDHVGAGLAGLGLVMGFGVFVLCTLIGVVLGAIASRRDPASRPADVALGLNVVSLVGVSLSAVLLVLL